MSENIMDTLRKKAALHRGYSHGLMGDSHTHCAHKEGTPEHMHWHHGYSEGLKECSGVWKLPGSM
jgi:ribosome modulation factor